MRVVIAGGGTGGHLYPGIAVARELMARDSTAEVSFVGTASGIESRVLPREGLELDLIRSSGLKGKSAGTLLRGLWNLPLGFVDAWRVISTRRPQLVIGVGGYSSGPRGAGGRASRHRDDGARAERGARFDEQTARAAGAGGGGDVRLDAIVFRIEGGTER